jgi:hypothetical protein
MRFMALAVRCSAAGVLSLPPPQAASTKLRASGARHLQSLKRFH